MEKVISAKKIEVFFSTKQLKYAIPNTPFSIDTTMKVENLSSLINGLLRETIESSWKEVEFDFLIGGEFLRLTIEDHLQIKDISSESTLEIEYVEKFPAPEPEDSLNHDDWVSSVHCNKDWILTGCYDNSIHLWKIDGTHKKTIPGHCGPVKAVKWIEVSEESAGFVSVSHDQTVMLWKMDIGCDAVTCIHVGRGHEQSIECVDVDKNASFLATGAWDNMVKIWSATFDDVKQDGVNGDSQSKKSTSSVKTPLMTLPGHKEAVSGVIWTENNEVISSSWDHTIKVWDAELGGMKSEIVGNKSFFSISRSPLNSTLITASADRHIRLYDPRSHEGSLVKATFTSHVGWVSTVNWSNTQECLFISGGHDNTLKLWDYRSPKAPLYDMTGHTDKILCSDWTNPSVMASGSADNTLKIFKSSE